jgi:ankyrin repeat protein
MKTKLMVLTLLLTAACCMRAATNDLTSALQKGLFEEEANHNLTAAIEAYQSVVGRFDEDRKLAATAIFRLGECYRKQGNTNDATAQYQRVLREFADQVPLIALSRRNLAALGAEPRPSASAVSNHLKTEQRRILEQQIELAQKDVVEKESSLHAGGSSPEALRAAQRELLNLKYQLAALDAGQTSPGQPSIDANGNPVVPATSSETEEVRRIRAMIRDSPDLINAKDKQGMTPLCNAAVQGQLVVAGFLLDSGADVDAKGGHRPNQTPLCYAVLNGHRAMLELLLARKADINTTDDEGRTPLLLAVQKGFKNIVEVLLVHSADVNAKNKDGATPLHFAAGAGSKPMVELLLTHGADVNAATLNGGTALHYQNDLPTAEVLIAHNANVNAADLGGRTPLSEAAEKGNVPVAQLLLSKGAAVDAKTSDGLTPLVLAVARKQKEMVEALLKAKAGSNVRFDFDRLHWYGPPVQPPLVWKDYTPLLLAARDGSVEIAASLLTYKADPNLSGGQGDFPILNAMTIGDPKSRCAMITLLLDHGADPNVADPDQKQTALMRAVNMLDKETAGILLAHKANVNARDRNGRSALEDAVYSSQNRDALAVAELLLGNGADVNSLDNEGKTPLNRAKDFAKGFWSVGQKASIEDMMALLLKNGAVEEMPRVDRIEASRASANYSHAIFLRGTNDWNRFTILELIAVRYQLLSGVPEVLPFERSSPRAFFARFTGPEARAAGFPDFTAVQIRRPKPDLKEWRNRQVDLTAALQNGDCSKDEFLEWGDVVEIPETDHPLNDQWLGFSRIELESLKKCLTRSVQVIVKGQTTVLTLALGYDEGTMGPVISGPVSFFIKPALRHSNLLLASSDLSHIKVTRHNPGTDRKHEYLVDCSEGQPAPDLWLRDGDIIEVPEKQ